MNLDDAINVHTEWRVRFRVAIFNHEKMDEATIGSDQCCELGQWLHGEGQSLAGQTPSYGVLLEKHAVFHREAGKVAQFINLEDFASAEGQLKFGSSYCLASQEVTLALLDLKEKTRK